MEDHNQHPNKFNVRVYGILLDDSDRRVLISKELYNGLRITKFPGGGLKFGEGVEDALVREFQEELNLDVKLTKLLYINDFLQISAFDPEDQLLAIYYQVRPLNPLDSSFPEQANKVSNQLHFKWVELSQLDGERLSFPVDQYVSGNLQSLLGPIGQ